MEEQTKSGNPLWLLITLPVFFLTWWLLGLDYALIFGLGALVILYVLCVWIPDDQARKINRQTKFSEARKLLKTVTEQIKEVKDREIVGEIKKALPTLEGLIDIFEGKSTAQGKIEEKVLPMLRNLSGLLQRWSGHESGRLPLEKIKAEKIRGILLHFDDLILKYQKDGIDPTDTYLTGLFELETDMLSVGINPKGE